jgi:hypothetical protein
MDRDSVRVDNVLGASGRASATAAAGRWRTISP